MKAAVIAHCLLAGCASPQVNQAEMTALAGDYYSGDGLGWNLSLTLEADGVFRCNWHGCVVGSDMSLVGDWDLEGDTITFTPLSDADEAFLRRYFEDKTARTATVEGNTVLIFADQEDFFAKYGPSTGSCFSREDARDVVSRF